jgi:serine protease Do
VRPGDTAVVIGSPLGFDESVSSGIVSAVNRDIMESPFDDYIQTDAAINHGNSGGPMFNVAGEVIGMNSVLFGPGTYSGSVGLGFAIPSNDLRFVFDRMMKNGKVDAGMLPIRTQQIKWMLAQAIGTPGLHGALVVGLEGQGDKMMKGQIKPGDVILTFNGETVLDPRDLARKAARLQSGTDAALEIFRDGQRMTVHVAVQAWPEGRPPVLNDAGPSNLGLQLAPGPHGGALVNAIDPMGSAADSGLQKGDVIIQVQAQPVTDPEQALQVLQAASANRRDFAAILVDRGGEQTWIPLAVPK